MFAIRARKWVSFGRRAFRLGLVLRLRLPLRREFQFFGFVLGRPRLLRYALAKKEKKKERPDLYKLACLRERHNNTNCTDNFYNNIQIISIYTMSLPQLSVSVFSGYRKRSTINCFVVGFNFITTFSFAARKRLFFLGPFCSLFHLLK